MGRGLKWGEGRRVFYGCQTLTLHIMNLCLQNKFGESHSQIVRSRKAPRDLNGHREYLFNPFFRTNSEKAKTKNQSKNRTKKWQKEDRTTNIMAIDFA